MTDDVTREVLAAEERRCAAIAAEDWEALDAIRGDSHYGSILDVLQVWVRRPQGWQIAAQHSVKLPAQ